MPRLIDHSSRRDELAEATWRVIQRDGVGGVSVRDVAAEAGLAVGSLRHVFATRAELLAYSMELVHHRVATRMTAQATGDDALDVARRTLAELLPLDATRRTEMEVNVALIAEGPAQPRLRQLALSAQRAVLEACLAMLELLRASAMLHPRRDLEREARRLHSVIDGLALHILVDPNLPLDGVLDALDDHLRQLAASPLSRRA